MISFSQRTKKDFILSFFILVIFYGITHNPIVRPKLNTIDNLWSIQKIQHPLLFGLSGHNYLVLKNDKNEIIKELHGLATDEKTGNWTKVGISKTDKLKVWEFDGQKNYRNTEDYPKALVASGNEEEIKNLWNLAKECKEKINTKNLQYPRFGFTLRGETENSNSVAYTLIKCMNLDEKRIGLIIPGEKNNLLETENRLGD